MVKRTKNEKWTAEEDRVMLDLLEEAKNNGLKIGNAWVTTMWPSVLQKFTERTGVVKTKDHVIHRFRTWKKIYKDVMKMLAKSGGEWDATTGRVTLEEYKWNELIAENGVFRKYRDVGCPLFGKITAVVTDSTATECTTTGCSGDDSDDHNDNEDIDLGASASAPVMDTSALNNDAEELEGSNAQLTRQKVGEGSSTRSHKRSKGAMLEEMDFMSGDALRDMRSIMKMFYEGNRTRAAMQALQEIPDLDDYTKFRATKFLKSPEDKEYFILLDVKGRKRWLQWCFDRCP